MKMPVTVRSLRVAARICGSAVSWATFRNLKYRGPAMARLLLAELVLCAFAVVFLTPTLTAQQDTTPGWPLHSSAPDHALPDAVGTQSPNIVGAKESCLMWTDAKVKRDMIGAATLKVPGKARGEYMKGCIDVKDKKLSSAEDHLRKAVQE